jgi:alpha-1,2-mannosyltransferase
VRSAVIGVVRDAVWLTPSRARAWLLLLAIAMGLALARDWSTLLLSHILPVIPSSLDPAGKPAPTDFLAFWSASRMALQGTPWAAYATDSMIAVQNQAAYLESQSYLGFFYPPIFLLLCLPLGLLAYPASLLAFVAATLAPLVVALRRLFPTLPARALLAFPAMMLNAATGQTGFLVGAGFACAALWLETRPRLAGCCLGLLAIKPHFVLLVPIALLGARRFCAAGAAAATVLGLGVLAYAVLGEASWLAWLKATGAARHALEQESNDWVRLFSVFTAARLLHLGLPTGYALQTLASLSAAYAVARVAVRRPGAVPEIATLAAASVIATPHVLDYDLVCLLLPMGWLAVSAGQAAWLGWEKASIMLVYAASLLGRGAAEKAGIPLGAAATLALLAVVSRRAFVTVPA